MTDESTKMVSEWCSSVIETLHPQSVLLVGSEMEEFARCFDENSIPAAAFNWEGTLPAELRQGGTEAPDTVIFSSDGAARLMVLPEIQFTEQFGAPRAVLVLLPLAETGPTLPEVSQRLSLSGYSRGFGDEKWLGSQYFTAIYRKGATTIDQLPWQFEAEWWRLAQINQKRRLLLSEYMTELTEIRFRYENVLYEKHQLAQEIDRHTEWSSKLQQELGKHEEWSKMLQQELAKHQEWSKVLQEENAILREVKAKWDEFEASALGKFCMFMQRIKKSLTRNGA